MKIKQKTIIIGLISFIMGCALGALVTYLFITPENTTVTITPKETTPQVAVKTNVEPAEEKPIDSTYDNAAIYIAKTVYGEARGCTTIEKAAVVWCILNRVDLRKTHTPNDIIAVVTAPSQFHGYSVNNPVTDDIYNLVNDVLNRWSAEKSGAVNVGRVLPKEYLFFHSKGDGHNYFQKVYQGSEVWDWRLENPYGV